MKRSLGLAISVLTLSSMTSASHAEGKRGYVFSDPRGVGATYVLPDPATVSHTIFLNRCTGGCNLTHSDSQNNSTTNTSTIALTGSPISAYAGTEAQWQQILSCVKATYAPFAVTITDQRPTSGDYHMAIVAGRASEAGQGHGVLGISPFACGGYIPNSISFSFANEEVSNIPDICWTVSQETAHSWGLDHKFDVRDPMTYLQSALPTTLKVFQNQAGPCGENGARPCTCAYPGTGTGGMNSYALIMATFGAGTPDSTPPTVSFQLPAANASITPGFSVIASAADNVGISKVELRIDGNLAGTSTSSPYQFTTSTAITQGSHTLELTAYDYSNNPAKATETVAYGQLCTDSGCTDASQVCVSGTCVLGPGTTGGLGSPCTDNSTCVSNSCGDDGTGNKFCVTACDPAASGACPSGFGCLATGTSGVCWPGADSGGGGGCSTSGSGSSTWMLVGLGLGAVLLARKRK
ncbi:hypothetical protein BH11MYX1_BH11MYX1_48560 [soil metagenome]